MLWMGFEPTENTCLGAYCVWLESKNLKLHWVLKDLSGKCLYQGRCGQIGNLENFQRTVSWESQLDYKFQWKYHDEKHD